MPAKTFKFLLLSVLLFGIIYAVHRYWVLPNFPNVSVGFVNFSYLFNFIIAVIMISIGLLMGKNATNYYGFLFLASGFLKLGIFLFLSKLKGFDLNRSLFLHFFVPYIIGLLIEIIFATRVLKGGNLKTNR